LRPFLAQLVALDAAARLGGWSRSREQSAKIVGAGQKARLMPAALNRMRREEEKPWRHKCR
jgi:alkylated DNA nucleotide flippase Atl1